MNIYNNELCEVFQILLEFLIFFKALQLIIIRHELFVNFQQKLLKDTPLKRGIHIRLFGWFFLNKEFKALINKIILVNLINMYQILKSLIHLNIILMYKILKKYFIVWNELK